jgi:hypothetical protein
MTFSNLYHPVPVAGVALGGGRAMVRSKVDGIIAELDTIESRVFGACVGYRTLERHAATAWQSGASADPAAIGTALGRLLTLGLLRGGPETFADVTRNPNVRRILTVVVTTADRPQLLDRCLESVASDFRNSGETPAVLVVDGSSSPQTAAVTESIVKARSTREGITITYFGQNEAARLRSLLSARGIPPDVIDFCLTPGEIGCNRNLAMLLTAGQHVLMVDDDVICAPWIPDVQVDGIAVTGHEDPREWDFFRSREAAVSGLRFGGSVLKAHSNVLGRTLGELLAASGSQTTLEHACSHMVKEVMAPSHCAVRVTFSGLAGDSARYCPYRLMMLSGPVFAVLSTSEEAFATALSSREVRRVVAQTTVTHEPSCMSYCMGLGNVSLVPPFLPVGRNEDGVFGVMLSFCDRQALFGHLNHGVMHHSDRPSEYRPQERMPSAVHTRVSEFVLTCVQSSAMRLSVFSPDERLRRLGTELQDMGSLSPADFEEMLAESHLGQRGREIALMGSGRAGSDLPDYWLEAIRTYQRRWVESAKDRAFFAPVEFRGASCEAGFARTQQFLSRFGSALTWWPRVWYEAAMLGGSWLERVVAHDRR